jgi:hypothetical protein
MESDDSVGGLSGYMGLYFDDDGRDSFLELWKKLRETN